MTPALAGSALGIAGNAKQLLRNTVTFGGAADLLHGSYRGRCQFREHVNGSVVALCVATAGRLVESAPPCRRGRPTPSCPVACCTYLPRVDGIVTGSVR